MNDHLIFAGLLLFIVFTLMLWKDFLAKPGPRDYGDACFHRLPPEALKRIWEWAPLRHLRHYPVHRWQYSAESLKRLRDLKMLYNHE